MSRRGVLAILVGTVAAAVAALRLAHAPRLGRDVPGGTLIDNAGVYDTLTGLLLGPLYDSIAADIAARAATGARILEVGCGPGHLSTRLARRGVAVMGVDLDPAMVERARANAARRSDNGRVPSFVLGDAASLPFPDGSFDLVVSTFSLHHWSDPTKGLADIGRVLRPGATALIWDLRAGAMPHPFAPARHAHMPDPAEHVRGSSLRLVSATPWRWPWRFSLAQRFELVRATHLAPHDAGHDQP